VQPGGPEPACLCPEVREIRVQIQAKYPQEAHDGEGGDAEQMEAILPLEGKESCRQSLSRLPQEGIRGTDQTRHRHDEGAPRVEENSLTRSNTGSAR
jgi:hypothetical protein